MVPLVKGVLLYSFSILNNAKYTYECNNPTLSLLYDVKPC